MRNTSLILRVGAINAELPGDTENVTEVGLSVNCKSTSKDLAMLPSIDDCFENVKRIEYAPIKCYP